MQATRYCNWRLNTTHHNDQKRNRGGKLPIEQNKIYSRTHIEGERKKGEGNTQGEQNFVSSFFVMHKWSISSGKTPYNLKYQEHRKKYDCFFMPPCTRKHSPSLFNIAVNQKELQGKLYFSGQFVWQVAFHHSSSPPSMASTSRIEESNFILTWFLESTLITLYIWIHQVGK